MVPADPTKVATTLFEPSQAGFAVVNDAVPATGAGFTVTVTVGADITVAHGEFVALTNMLRVAALVEELMNVILKVVGLPVTVNVVQVTWLSSEYSYVAPAIYEFQVAENDTLPPVQMVVALVADNDGMAVKFAFTTTLTGLE